MQKQMHCRLGLPMIRCSPCLSLWLDWHSLERFVIIDLFSICGNPNPKIDTEIFTISGKEQKGCKARCCKVSTTTNVLKVFQTCWNFCFLALHWPIGRDGTSHPLWEKLKRRFRKRKGMGEKQRGKRKARSLPPRKPMLRWMILEKVLYLDLTLAMSENTERSNFCNFLAH